MTRTAAPSQSDEARIAHWIEANVGGVVTRCERQMRWRKGWYVDTETNGLVRHFYVRGDRGEEFPPWPLEYECKVLEILGDSPIPVPAVHGLCPDPKAMVLDHVPGIPGLLNCDGEGQRLAILEQLAGYMAAMHQLPLGPFLEAGLKAPETREERALSPFMFEGEKLYLKYKAAPDPRLEFVRGWLRRNIPEGEGAIAFIHSDPGQFLFEDGRITAMLDFELAALGDPVMDLAGLRLRALHEPMGDIAPLFTHYARITGQPIPREKLCFQTAVFSAGTAFTISPALAEAKGGVDYPEYISWYIVALLFTLDAIAEAMGIRLEKPMAMGPVAPGRWAGALHVLSRTCAAIDGDGGDAPSAERSYRAGLIDRLTRFIERRDSLGPALDAAYADEVARLVGSAVMDWRDADALLEAFVANADSSRDEALLRVFHRWCWGQVQLLEGVVPNEMWKLALQPADELLAGCAELDPMR